MKSVFFIFVCVVNYFKFIPYYFLYDSRFLHLLSHLLVLSDEALDENVLVADTPTLIYNNSHKHKHHYDKGGGYGNGEDKCYIHKHCLFDFDSKIRLSSRNNSPMVGKQSPISRKCVFLVVSKREKGV